jgi:hypothetical protein
MQFQFRIFHVLILIGMVSFSLAYFSGPRTHVTTIEEAIRACRVFLQSSDDFADKGSFQELEPLLTYQFQKDSRQVDILICAARIVENGQGKTLLVKMGRFVPLTGTNELCYWGECYDADHDPCVSIFDRRPSSSDLQTISFPEIAPESETGKYYLFRSAWKKFMSGAPPKRHAIESAG